MTHDDEVVQTWGIVLGVGLVAVGVYLSVSLGASLVVVGVMLLSAAVRARMRGGHDRPNG